MIAKDHMIKIGGSSQTDSFICAQFEEKILELRHFPLLSHSFGADTRHSRFCLLGPVRLRNL